jgi:hypothetical protein
LLDEKSEEIEIARSVVSRSATNTFTSPEKAACVLAEVLPEERRYTESNAEPVSFVLRDCCRGAANVEEAARSWLNVSNRLGWTN